jgi:hypothetical protein
MSQTNERISFLLQAWVSRRASRAEEAELMEWFAGGGDSVFLQEYTNRLLAAYNESEPVPAADWETLYEKILQNRDNTSLQPVIRMGARYRWKAIAAVFILVVSAAAILFINRNRTAPPTATTKPVASDALPGRDRALLTLANGNTIVLDNAKGQIVQQGQLIVTNNNGQLDYHGSSGKIEYHTLTTPRGGQYTLQLPDGTNVWLNAASSISYPTAFTGNRREVTITGEAYFEVVPLTPKGGQKKIPFIVKVLTPSGDGGEVEVLGTHFNINSYSDDGSIKTTLLEGKVKVINRQLAIGNGQQTAILHPGEQATLSGVEGTTNHKLQTTNKIDIEQIMAWKNGSFNFEHQSFAAAMKQLSRWYDVDIVYESQVPSINLGGEMKRDLKLSQVLKGLGRVGVQFRIEGKKLVVLP